MGGQSFDGGDKVMMGVLHPSGGTPIMFVHFLQSYNFMSGTPTESSKFLKMKLQLFIRA